MESYKQQEKQKLKTVKAYLYQAKSMNKSINAKMAEIEELQEKAESVQSFRINAITVHTNENTSNQTVDRIIDMQIEINAEIDRLTDLRREIKGSIKKLTDTRFRDLLNTYYIADKTLEECADILNYSTSHIFALHRDALRAFVKIV